MRSKRFSMTELYQTHFVKDLGNKRIFFVVSEFLVKIGRVYLGLDAGVFHSEMFLAVMSKG
jgi:hypothetical protein